jgi:uridine phosphorylase
LKNSELITNQDHSIYHLKLKNAEIAPRIITVGDPDRVEVVARNFDHIRLSRKSREFYTVTGRIGNMELTVISTGIGTDNIDIVLNELALVNGLNLESGEPLNNPLQLQILRLGTSGAIQADVPLDSILLSASALSFDGLLAFYAQDFEQPSADLPGLPQPYLTHPSAHMMNQFTALTPYQGITVTAAGFYAPQGRNILTTPLYPDFIQRLSALRIKEQRLTNLEMETAGIYGLGALLGMETLSISAILANRLTGEFSKKPQQTIEKMIAGALEIFSVPR